MGTSSRWIGLTKCARPSAPCAFQNTLLEWTKAQGADILSGRAFETGNGLPYLPLIEAFRNRIERENAPDDLLSDIWLSELSRLLPELQERYPDLPAPRGDETTAGIRLFEAIVRLGQALVRRCWRTMPAQPGCQSRHSNLVWLPETIR